MPNVPVRIAAVNRVLVDMDGVLADLHTGVLDVLGIPDPYDDPAYLGVWDWWAMMGLKKPTFWRRIAGAEFWADLPPMPYAFELLELLVEEFGADNLAVCTTPPDHTPLAGAGKRMWLERHAPWLADRLIKTDAKEMAGGPDALLLDDGPHNVEAFRARHGQAILMPTRGNDNHEYADNPLSYVRDLLH